MGLSEIPCIRGLEDGDGVCADERAPRQGVLLVPLPYTAVGPSPVHAMHAPAEHSA